MNAIPSGIMDLIERLTASGAWTIGEIVVNSDYSLRHRDDRDIDQAKLATMTRAEDAREIAKYDADGAYRPLKSAPNLKPGWQLKLESAAAVRTALDYFYPAAIGMYLSALRGKITPVPLRETLGRQTGMYRITQLIRDDQAESLILKACNSDSGCLRQLLWDLAPGTPQPLTQAQAPQWPSTDIPLLCVEACNLLVAACRPLGKANLPKSTPSPTS